MSVRSNRGHRCVVALTAIGCALALSACGSSSKPASSASATHATPGDFGWSVALDGPVAVVGAPGKNPTAGAEYVFARSETAWSEQAKLTASDATSGGQFGFSVALDGSVAVVGAPGKNSTAGAAYVFVRSGTAWSQQAKLTASHGAAGDTFGGSVSILGATAVVSAPTTNALTGAAYVFVRSRGKWSQQAKLTASDATSRDLFGAAVVIAGSTAVVGAPFKNSKTGAAYVFTRSRGKWSQRAKLTATHL